MPITMRQIEAFRAVADAGSVTRAARFLNISSPAVSRLISDLETELGGKLFRRTHGRVARTEEANALYEVVRRAFIGLEQIESVAKSIVCGHSGNLRVVAMQNIADRFLLDLIGAFAQAHPDVHISLEICSQMQVMELLATRQYDMGFIMHPCTASAFRVERFFVQDAVCVLPSEHALARQSVVRIEDLRDVSFIDFPRFAEFRMRIDEAFNAASVEREARIEARTNRSICSLVSQGLGVSIIALSEPEHALRPGVAVRPFSPAIPIEVNMVFPAGSPTSKLTQNFAEFSREFRDRHLV